MVLVPDSVIALWQSNVDDINIDLGVACTFIFEGGFESTANVASDTIGLKPRVSLPYGGRAPAQTVTGEDFTSNEAEAGQGLRHKEITKDITARVYHRTPAELVNYNISIAENENVYEVVMSKKSLPDIERAKEMILFSSIPEKRLRSTLIRPPVVYGMGSGYQCRSFWKQT